MGRDYYIFSNGRIRRKDNTIYFIDTDDTVKKVVMDNEIKTVEIANPQAPIRNFTLTDASFPSVVIKDGQIILEDN